MAEARDLLLEVGTEELPPGQLASLGEALAVAVRNGLAEAGLAPGAAHAYASPRRLAVWLEQVPPRQPEREQTRRGPAMDAAFDGQGRPTPAADGFARSCGVNVADLEVMETDKGRWLMHRTREPGRDAAAVIPEVCATALSGLPVARRMRWGDGDVEFIRPIHWMVLLLGNEVVQATLLGLATGRATRGHRFHGPDELILQSPAEYAERLRAEGHVIADFDERREAIRAQVAQAAREQGGEPVWSDWLLNEVAALVEWPVSLAGGYDERFLELPREVLVSTMQDHQRYFPVANAGGALLPRFVAVSNIDSREPEHVRRGNERVIRPRLADAAFFWERDRREPLAARREGLRQMVFQERLGTLYDKTGRIEVLGRWLAPAFEADPEAVARAALLAKCDLLTRMVGEFPDLQGVMGRHYALADGEPEAVAQAIEGHYRPRAAGDALPPTPEGRALAVADRLDSLLGLFAVDQRPGGDRDPYGLRRAALGTIRILIEGAHPVDLRAALSHAATGLDAVDAAAVVDEVVGFVMERLHGYYAERGVSPELVDAVLAVGPACPLDVDRRIQACLHFQGLPEAESLAVAHKRAHNILRRADEQPPAAVDVGLLQEDAERALHEALERVDAEIQPAVAQGDYASALTALAGLRSHVDRFFDDVMVNVEDGARRRNRLALVQHLARELGQVADVSRLSRGQT